MKPFFSIIVPVYKVEHYLDECVQSVLPQTFSGYECILVDDGSPDTCPAMCDEYAKKQRRIKVIHKENGGLSDARNAGILAADGEYIVLLDSDDKFADNNTLNNLFDVIQKNKTDVVVNVNWFTFTDNGKKTQLNRYDKNIALASPMEIAVSIRKSGSFLAGWLFVLNRKHLIKNSLFFKKGILREDEHWMPRVLGTTQKIALNHAPFYAYRIARSCSIMSSISNKNLFDTFSIIDELFEWAKDKKTYGKYGRSVMRERIKEICRITLGTIRDNRQQLKEDYNNICVEFRKRIKRIPNFYFEKRFLYAVVLGVDNAYKVSDFNRKIKNRVRGKKQI
jgi:glycosyltransferase involved in cell wall biosynthesis